ncbi:DUF932 domain-containing protein [Propionicimonas paludicola]|uniref:DUF932 domain-containing protein n=1 Tax=Propionicimonas paludicola TaxID=185243 RepID=UPI001B801E1F|nr:DUF932 domain-containing protein [Propionicimonas paludicola]
MSAAIGTPNDRRLKVKHFRNSLGKIGSVRDALGIVHKAGDAFAEQVRRLTDEAVSEARWAAFVDVYAEASSDTKRAATIAGQKADELHRLWNHDSRVNPWRGTAYGVVAAVNTYVHHVQEVRGADRTTRNMERMITGGVDQLDAGTLALLATV